MQGLIDMLQHILLFFPCIPCIPWFPCFFDQPLQRISGAIEGKRQHLAYLINAAAQHQ